MTSVLSILHRLSGVVLSAGFVLVLGWVVALAYGPNAYGYVYGFIQTVWGKIFLSGFAAAFFYHLAAGVRHLLWDAGWGFKLPQVYATGTVVLVFASLATAVVAIRIWGLA